MTTGGASIISFVSAGLPASEGGTLVHRATDGAAQSLMQGRAAVARLAHNQKAAGSNPAPATNAAANPSAGSAELASDGGSALYSIARDEPADTAAGVPPVAPAVGVNRVTLFDRWCAAQHDACPICGAFTSEFCSWPACPGKERA